MDAEDDFDKMVNYISSVEVKEIIIKLIYNGLINQEYSKPVLEKFAKEMNGNIFDANDPVHTLVHWDEYSNKEIISAMTDIKNKLEHGEYGSEACSRIILYSCHLFENGFDEGECRGICDKVCEYLNNSEDLDYEIELPRFNMKENVDYSFYNEYSEKVKQIRLKKSQDSLRNELSNILNTDTWGVLLEQYFGSISHIDNQQLFKHLDKEKLISKIKEHDRVQLKHFILSLEYRYASSNYYQYLSGDLEYLTDLYDEIKSVSKTGETATDYQLKLLKEKLQGYIKEMSDYRGKLNNNVDSGDSKNAMTTT